MCPVGEIDRRVPSLVLICSVGKGARKKLLDACASCTFTWVNSALALFATRFRHTEAAHVTGNSRSKTRNRNLCSVLGFREWGGRRRRRCPKLRDSCICSDSKLIIRIDSSTTVLRTDVSWFVLTYPYSAFREVGWWLMNLHLLCGVERKGIFAVEEKALGAKNHESALQLSSCIVSIEEKTNLICIPGWPT